MELRREDFLGGGVGLRLDLDFDEVGVALRRLEFLGGVELLRDERGGGVGLFLEDLLGGVLLRLSDLEVFDDEDVFPGVVEGLEVRRRSLASSRRRSSSCFRLSPGGVWKAFR